MTVLLLIRFCHLSEEWLWVFSVSLQFRFNRWLLSLIAVLKTEEFPNKMPLSSEFQRQTILSEKTDSIRASVLNIWSHSFPFFVCSPVSHAQFQSFTWFPKVSLRPLVGLRPPSNFYIYSLSLPVLSKKQHQNVFSLHAGVTEGVNSPAAHRVLWYDADATKSWLHSATLKKSAVQIKKCQLTRHFLFGW